tara:strand:+ start:3401 stop:4414 length:1014 start_codon:yes stop_codon:yes gene_type:complete
MKYFLYSLCVLAIAILFSNQQQLTMTFPEKSERLETQERAAVAPKKNCKDDHENCHFWKLSGECDKNPIYMLHHCPLSCDVCDEANTDKNDPCYRNNGTALVKEGDIKNTMERIASSFSFASLLHANPWVVQIENFLKEDEIDSLLKMCEGKYVRSLAGDGVSKSRTSEQCWCQDQTCLNDKNVGAISSKISGMLQSSIQNTEFLQIIRYDEGQFYSLHHDQNAGYHVPCGPRVYTFFMYLNTPEEGGETWFPDINLKVKAQKGRAIIWNSILNNNVSLPDLRTHHEALPVKKGMKMAANYWFHLYDFRTPFSRGCASISKNSYNPEIFSSLSKAYY